MTNKLTEQDALAILRAARPVQRLGTADPGQLETTLSAIVGGDTDRDLFTDLAPTAEYLPGPRFEHRRLRRLPLVLAPILAAAAVIAVAVGIAAVGRSPDHPPATSDGVGAETALPVSSYVFSMKPIPGMTSTDASTSPTAQYVLIAAAAGATTPGAGTEVTVYAAGSWHPQRPRDAATVSVNGQAGYYGTLAFDEPAPAGTAAASRAGTGTGVVWQDTHSGLWASVSLVTQAASKDPAFVPLARDQAVQIADATQIGVPHPARVPAKFAHLPAGYVLRSVAAPTYYQSSALTLGPDGQAAGTLSIGIDPTGSYGAQRADNYQPPPASSKSWTPITVGAFTGFYITGPITGTLAGYTPGEAVISDGTFTVVLSTLAGAPPLPLAEVAAIVQGITLPTRPADPTTWFDVSVAVP